MLESAENLTRDAQRLLTGRNKLAQEFTAREISRVFKANGNPPPIAMAYMEDAKTGWAKWKLEISGLVNGGSLYAPGPYGNAGPHPDYASRLRRRLERDRQMERCSVP